MSAAVWSLDTIWRVSGLYAQVTVDGYALATGIDARAVGPKLFPMLESNANALGVDIRAEDVRIDFAEPGDAPPFVGRFTMRWAPHTEAVELRGGHADGQRIHWRGAPLGEALRVPLPPSSVFYSDPSDGLPSLEPTSTTYSLAGWNEGGWWVYGVSVPRVYQVRDSG